MDALELCSKLHPKVAIAVGSERSLLVEANNEFEQNRSVDEYVDVLERWENRLIKAARSVGADCYCIPQTSGSQGDHEAMDKMMSKVDELHEKLDKIDKAKHASKRGGAGRVNVVDEDDKAMEEGINAVEYGGMGGGNA